MLSTGFTWEVGQGDKTNEALGTRRVKKSLPHRWPYQASFVCRGWGGVEVRRWQVRSRALVQPGRMPGSCAMSHGRGSRGKDSPLPALLCFAWPEPGAWAHEASGNASHQYHVALPQKPVSQLAWEQGTQLSLGIGEWSAGTEQGDMASLWPAWWLDNSAKEEARPSPGLLRDQPHFAGDTSKKWEGSMCAPCPHPRPHSHQGHVANMLYRLAGLSKPKSLNLTVPWFSQLRMGSCHHLL